MINKVDEFKKVRKWIRAQSINVNDSSHIRICDDQILIAYHMTNTGNFLFEIHDGGNIHDFRNKDLGIASMDAEEWLLHMLIYDAEKTQGIYQACERIVSYSYDYKEISETTDEGFIVRAQHEYGIWSAFVSDEEKPFFTRTEKNLHDALNKMKDDFLEWELKGIKVSDDEWTGLSEIANALQGGE